jgi:hypothetical protein
VKALTSSSDHAHLLVTNKIVGHVSEGLVIATTSGNSLHGFEIIAERVTHAHVGCSQLRCGKQPKGMALAYGTYNQIVRRMLFVAVGTRRLTHKEMDLLEDHFVPWRCQRENRHILYQSTQFERHKNLLDTFDVTAVALCSLSAGWAS